jgi:hypothetical protein
MDSIPSPPPDPSYTDTGVDTFRHLSLYRPSNLWKWSCSSLRPWGELPSKPDFASCPSRTLTPACFFPPLFFLSLFVAGLSKSQSRPRVILIQQYGQLVGLVTIKDILRYELEVEHEHAGAGAINGPLGPYNLEAVLEELRDSLTRMLSRLSAVFSGRGGGLRAGIALSSSSSHSRWPQEEEEVVFDAGQHSEETIELHGH